MAMHHLTSEGWLNAMCNLEICPLFTWINKISLANIHFIRALKLVLLISVSWSSVFRTNLVKFKLIKFNTPA